MTWITLACLASLGSWDGNASPPGASDSEVAAEYRRLRDDSGRGAEDQVRLALWCEAHGLAAERVRHLALAVLVDPAHVTARGLLGLVRRDGRWAAPDEVAEAVRTDPARVALLAEYDDRRSKAAYTAQAQWALVVWADAHGLSEQARAHCVAVSRLDPGREAAWKRLGYRQHRGGWATDGQIAADRAEAAAQRLADRRWRPFLESRKAMLERPDRRDAARKALGEITDPRAVPAIVQVFGGADEADQRLAVMLLGQIASPPSSLGLAHLAVASGSVAVRDEALDHLSRRDPRDFVDSLIRLVRAPWRGSVRPVAGPGAIGELLVEGDDYNLRAVVRSPVLSASAVRVPGRGNLLAARMVDLAERDALERAGPTKAPTAAPVEPAGTRPQGPDDLNRTREWAQLDRDNARRAGQALEARVAQVREDNAQIEFRNGRVVPVLAAVTGRDFGADRRAWARWSTEQAGYAMQSSGSSKPTVTEQIDAAYQTELPPPPAPPRASHSCFAAGTPVRTLDGARLIESLQLGDQVLVQDGRTGTLSYQPVVMIFHNPPNATLRVKLGADEVVATGIHRFWKAGVGWTMARDLKPGDLLRVLGGTVAVAAVEPDRAQPVFNLEVAEGRSFFVGRLGVLVHDNTLVEATPEPFDASPPSVGRAITP